MNSRETQRKQNHPKGNYPKEAAVQPQETLEGQSVAPALANTAPCEEGEYQLLVFFVKQKSPKMPRKIPHEVGGEFCN
jgi:hypothetical protein